MITIYHNPRCSKSRQTLELLREHDIQPEVILYLEDTPDRKTIKSILKKLGLKPRDLMRMKEAEYQENALDNPALSDDELIQALIDHPKLIERPIVVNGDKAAIGWPPESVLTII